MTDRTADPVVVSPAAGKHPPITRSVVMGCALAMALMSVVSIWLRLRVPVPIGISYYDDILFLRTATFLAEGAWLGPFDNLTLAKGPAYPAFTAALHAGGIPLKLGEQLTFLLAAGCTAAGVWLISRRLILAAATYCLLALDPINFSSQSAELIRDNWHASLSLLFPAAVFLALAMASRRSAIGWVVAVSIGAGISGATYWLCREEGVSILPTIAVIGVGLPLLRLGSWVRRPKSERFSGTARTTMVRYGLATVLIALAFVLPVAAVGLINDRHYGAHLTNDVGAGQFARTYADWTRVDGGSTEPLVPISYSQREAVYRVSAAARELQPFLESVSSPWNVMACSGRTECPYPGAFMTWAIRDAAAQAGHFGSATAAQAFFAQLDAELVAGCDSGALDCSAALPAPVQPLLRAAPAELLGSLATIVGRVLTSQDLFDEPATYWPDPLGRRDASTAIVDGLPADGTTGAEQFVAFDDLRWPYDTLGVIYRWVILVLALLGLIGILGGWWYVRRSRPLLILATALAVGFLVRSMLLALINTVEYDATIARYQLASHMLLIGAAVSGSAALLDELLTRRRGRVVVDQR